jgi:hypothetical protein
MEALPHVNKKVLIGAGIACAVILAGFLYYSLTDTEAPDSALTALGESPLDLAAGRDLLVTLSRLRSTKLNLSIFSDPVFTSLEDFGVEIASQPVGRRNPFADFGATTGSVPSKGAPAPALPKSPGGKTTASGKAPAMTKDTSGESSGFDVE